jgi:hypothetical protein
MHGRGEDAAKVCPFVALWNVKESEGVEKWIIKKNYV